MIFNEILIHTFETNGRRSTLRERLNMRKHCGPYRWTPAEPMKGRGFYQNSKGLKVGDSTFDLRLKYANDVLAGGSRLSHIDGYYCDEYGDSTLTPIIALLPHGRGFLAGWTMGEGMCASIGADIYQDETDAAYAAHQEAERQAEREREYQTSQNVEDEDEDET